MRRITRREWFTGSLKCAASAAFAPALTSCFAIASGAAPSQQSPPLNSGDRILFDSDRDGNSEIYVMDADGSHKQRLTHTPGAGKNSTQGRWSPDRTKIAFISNRDENTEIYVMHADGFHVRRLTRTVGRGKENFNPAWSPYGNSIVFDSNRDGKSEVYIMDADGSNVRQLTHTLGERTVSWNPDWSPSGEKIAFNSDATGPADSKKVEIYVMDADGSHVQRITNTPGRHNWTPRWSPDGKRIVFSSNRSDPKEDRNEETGEIYVMNADGSDVRQLTRYGFGAFRPGWSPDGKRIVFMSSHHAKTTEDKDFEIYVMDADGANVRRLTFNKYYDAHPAW